MTIKGVQKMLRERGAKTVIARGKADAALSLEPTEAPQEETTGMLPLDLPVDAAERDIEDGDPVRLFNERGACLGIAVCSDSVRSGVVQMTTGAWWDPDEDGMCRHGNPNALTCDTGTSQLGQGPTAHTCLVEIERYDEPLPDFDAFNPPVIKKDLAS